MKKRIYIETTIVSYLPVDRVDVLLTWNCRHLANADVHIPVGRFLRSVGYEPPAICTPNEFMGVGNREE